MTTLPPDPQYRPLLPNQRFPPIPEAPDGVAIVSFDDFVVSGINVPVDELDDMIEPDEDYEEFDALGIATVALPSHKKDHHSLANRLKRRKGAKDKNSPASNTWWGVWDETESVRRKIYDQRLPSSERLFIAAEDFRDDRPWPAAATGISNFWDQFRMYIGLLAHPKHPNQKDDANADAEDDDVEDMGEPVNDPPQAHNADIKVAVGKKPKAQQPSDVDDPRTQRLVERFLDDPEASIKIFLSSYFRTKGMLWSRQRCQALPILIRYFLAYLIRCKTFSEKDIDGALRRALEVAKRAEVELPKTGEIALSLPNNVGNALVSLWGPRRTYSKEPVVQDRAIAQDIAAQERVHEDARRAVEEERAEIARVIALREEEERLARKEEERLAQEEERLARERASELQRQLEYSAGASVAAIEDGRDLDESDDVTEDVSAEDAWDGPESGGESGAWPSPGAERGTWGGDDTDEDEEDPWAVAAPSLTSILGPTALPLTHRTGVVEYSTRRIKEVIQPASRRPCKKANDPSAEAVEEDLATHFVRVVLEPWPLVQVRPNVNSQIEPPTVLPSSHGKVDLGRTPSPGVEGHAPLRDTVTVLLDPTAASVLENAIGMGLGATWTQIKREERVGGKKGKDKDTRSFWYMEGLFHQIPSYWMDDANESDYEDETD